MPAHTGTDPITPPSWHPGQEVLECVELVVVGALSGLPDGLEVPPEIVAAAGAPAGVQLEDAEGTPVALLSGHQVRGLAAFTHGPLRSRRRTPEQVRADLDSRAMLAVPVDGSLSRGQVTEVVAAARARQAGLLWLVLVGPGRRRDLPVEGLLRAVDALAADLTRAEVPGLVVPLPLPRLHPDPAADRDLIAEVAARYGAADLLDLPDPAPVGPASGLASGSESESASGQSIAGARDGRVHPAFGPELLRAVPPPSRRGVTVFLTGLSGSGKSTIAKGLAERLLADGRRTVTLLDGDEVRRLLSHGLGFSRADRELNIRRIGFVAAELTRHGGVAICAPIAPFDAGRREVRRRVEEVGDFVLVHVSTPLAECERRDRKGHYARARRGEVAEFTGISSPYEPPRDAELAIDTTGMQISTAVDLVWRLLVDRGYLGAPATAGEIWRESD